MMIRPATKADIDSLVSLLKLLFRIEADFQFDADKQRRGLAMLLESGKAIIMVAENQSRVAGMVTGQLVVSTAEGGYSLLIEDLVVAPEHQGNGYGPMLLEAIAVWAQSSGASRMQLLADTANARALHFYSARNWRKTQLICLRKYAGQAALRDIYETGTNR